ncbi:HD family hydrolase [Natronomonas pharaonis DSM 2160]|uniref:5'-deoxynucleotidase n=1 Tax=Natronomonas pharaonis (strain ATCC 35678 / DSM 2160 / CIP 103997 / JCM 8858 / NBRC 14720 / NCIMB 2260 / Gabara) TaxID=348780 RepID=A0A1U7EUN5_NATPD|nr:HD domain-containing protein [Natronomonas pharaonis]CAI48694.1 HD family hydrolase [Natronomonas pharaonis DSM 2160]
MTGDIDAALSALADAYALKDERRTGWQLRAVENPESVAAHSWGVATLVVRFCPDDLDRERALSLAVVHDIAEAEVGDIPTRADPDADTVDDEEKVRRERAALSGPLAGLGDDIRELWEAYERRDSPEARFVKDMDLLDTCLQALVYERDGRYDADEANPHFEAYDGLDEFFATSEPRLSTDRGRDLFERVRARYEALS